MPLAPLTPNKKSVLSACTAALLILASLLMVPGASAGIGDWFRRGVPVDVIHMPEDTTAAKLSKVVVMDFTGEDGRSMASDLRTHLRDAKIIGKTLYDVSADTMMEVNSGDMANLLSVARKNDLDAVYFGSTEMRSDTSSQYHKTVCKKSKGFLKKCKEEEEVTCKDHTGSYSAKVSVLDVRARKVIFEERRHDTAHDRSKNQTEKRRTRHVQTEQSRV